MVSSVARKEIDVSISVECIIDCRARLGEGAWWDSSDQELWWVDIKAGDIHSYDPVTGTDRRYGWGEPVACLARRDAGGLVVGAASGLYLFLSLIHI